MYIGLNHLHSSFRYLVIGLLLITIVVAYKNWKTNSNYSNKMDKLSLFTMIFLHLQMTVGIALYFISPMVSLNNIGEVMKDSLLRFYTVEHSLMMLTGVALVTFGRISSKKAETDALKHSRIFKFFLAGLLLIFVSIPWPFLKSFGNWF